MELPTTHYDTPVKEAEGRSKRSIWLEKISIYIFIVAISLAPLVFIPSIYTQLDVVKTIFISSCIIISCVLYALSVLSEKTLPIPRGVLSISILGITLSILISTILSSNVSKSFFGQGFEVGTASFLILMFVSLFLVTRIAMKDKELFFSVYTAIIGSFAVLAIFHILRIIGGPSFLDLGFLTNLSSSIVGKWYDLGIMGSIVGLLSVIALKFLTAGKTFRRILISIILITGVFLFIINSSFIWGSIALVSLFIGLYEYFTVDSKGRSFKKISLLTLTILILSTTLLLKGDVLAGSAIKALKVDQKEVSLPWDFTNDIVDSTIKESPFFGAGPNRFGYQFLRFKPAEINSTPFWNSEFANGSGTIPTFIVTQGIFGIIAWALFFILFIKEGVLVLRRVNDPIKRFFSTSSIFITLFLWMTHIFYTPSHTIMFLTFVFTGLSLAVFHSEGRISEKVIGTVEGSKARTSVYVYYWILIVVLLVWLGMYIKKSVAISYFHDGIKELSVGSNTSLAQDKFKKALLWDASDIYYQALSEVNIIKITGVAQDIQSELTANPKRSPNAGKVDQLNNLIKEAISYAKSAIAEDPSNYYNHLSEARISEIAASLKIQNGYERAKDAYLESLKSNPFSPSIYLSLARLEMGQNKLTEAGDYVSKALGLRADYTEAIFLLSQIQVAGNKITEAIASAVKATQLNPNDPALFFHLGLLYYNDKNYSDASIALSKAVNLNNQYANARYFLGLSYARLGKNGEALIQFQEIAKTNPNNKEVAFIISNLKAGKSPFNDVKPPIDNKPENRKTLPLNDRSVSKTVQKNTTTKVSEPVTTKSKVNN